MIGLPVADFKGEVADALPGQSSPSKVAVRSRGCTGSFGGGSGKRLVDELGLAAAGGGGQDPAAFV